MKNPPNKYLINFLFFGLAMWFFGNFYEAIVLGPNMISNSYQRLMHWQQFFVVTNPVHFYVPLTQIALLLLIVTYFRIPKSEAVEKKLFGRSAFFALLSLVITIYIITEVNMTIFFGDLSKNESIIPPLALRWNLFNGIRVLTSAISLFYYFDFYFLYRIKLANKAVSVKTLQNIT